jgi:hypothetical protein
MVMFILNVKRFKSLLTILSILVFIFLSSLRTFAQTTLIGSDDNTKNQSFNRNYSVVLLASKAIFPPGTELIGDDIYDFRADSELEDYVELLSTSGIPFEIMYHEDLELHALVKNNNISCVSIVIAVDSSELSDHTVNILEKLSNVYGVSIIASSDRIDQRLASLFGISKIMGRKWHMPVIVKINKPIKWAPHLTGEIRLGQGWQLKRHPGGFRRNWKQFLSQVRSYRKVKPLPDANIIAVTQDDYPAIIEYQYGKAKNYYIALNSDWYLEQFNKIHQIVKRMIIENSGNGMAYFDLSKTAVLRLDDPGSCVNAYLLELRNLEIDDWKTIVQILKKHNSVLNIAYVSGWIDDANSSRGDIYLKGKLVNPRREGAIYNSKDIIYAFKKTNLKLDYSSQYEGIKIGLEGHYFNIESHGHTHLNPDMKAWLNSEDKYTNEKWWSEFKDAYRGVDVKSEIQGLHMLESKKKLFQAFGVPAVAIIPPSHQASKDTEFIAREQGFLIFSSEYNSILKEDFIIRNDRIPSIFTKWYEPDKKYSESVYPVVTLFHDYDLTNNVKWLADHLTKWEKAGIQRFISFKELAGYLFAEVNGGSDNEKINLLVNISKPIGHSIKYFSENDMTIMIKIPNGKDVETVKVNESFLENYKIIPETNEIKIRIAPFLDSYSKQITVVFQK